MNQSFVILTKRYIFFEHLDAENSACQREWWFTIFRYIGSKPWRDINCESFESRLQNVLPNQPSSFVPGYDPAVEATFLGYGPTFIIDPPVRSCTSIIPPILCHGSNNSVREVFPGSLNLWRDSSIIYSIDILTNPINGSRRDKGGFNEPMELIGRSMANLVSENSSLNIQV